MTCSIIARPYENIINNANMLRGDRTRHCLLCMIAFIFGKSFDDINFKTMQSSRWAKFQEIRILLHTYNKEVNLGAVIILHLLIKPSNKIVNVGHVLSVIDYFYPQSLLRSRTPSF